MFTSGLITEWILWDFVEDDMPLGWDVEKEQA